MKEKYNNGSFLLGLVYGMTGTILIVIIVILITFSQKNNYVKAQIEEDKEETSFLGNGKIEFYDTPGDVLDIEYLRVVKVINDSLAITRANYRENYDLTKSIVLVYHKKEGSDLFENKQITLKKGECFRQAGKYWAGPVISTLPPEKIIYPIVEIFKDAPNTRQIMAKYTNMKVNKNLKTIVSQ